MPSRGAQPYLATRWPLVDRTRRYGPTTGVTWPPAGRHFLLLVSLISPCFRCCRWRAAAAASLCRAPRRPLPPRRPRRCCHRGSRRAGGGGGVRLLYPPPGGCWHHRCDVRCGSGGRARVLRCLRRRPVAPTRLPSDWTLASPALVSAGRRLPLQPVSRTRLEKERKAAGRGLFVTPTRLDHGAVSTRRRAAQQCTARRATSEEGRARVERAFELPFSALSPPQAGITTCSGILAASPLCHFQPAFRTRLTTIADPASWAALAATTSRHSSSSPVLCRSCGRLRGIRRRDRSARGPSQARPLPATQRPLHKDRSVTTAPHSEQPARRVSRWRCTPEAPTR